MTSTPNKTNIRAWVEALRSGNFVQGESALRLERDGKATYCCLGVACEVSPIQRGEVVSSYTHYGESTTELPQEVVDWLGIDSNNPYLAGHSAVTWNDTEKKSFAEIADLIEAEYLTA